jgi:hypothetical protein
MTVKDTDGVFHRYLGYFTSLRRAEREARAWVQSGSVEGETLVGVRPAQEKGSLRGLLALACLAFVACGVTITAAIIFGLSLGGAL